MTSYESMVKWANKNGFPFKPMGNDGKLCGLIIDTDRYTGPYPNAETFTAVEQVEKAAKKRGLRFQAAPVVYTCVRVWTD